MSRGQQEDSDIVSRVLIGGTGRKSTNEGLDFYNMNLIRIHFYLKHLSGEMQKYSRALT